MKKNESSVKSKSEIQNSISTPRNIKKQKNIKSDIKSQSEIKEKSKSNSFQFNASNLLKKSPPKVIIKSHFESKYVDYIYKKKIKLYEKVILSLYFKKLRYFYADICIGKIKFNFSPSRDVYISETIQKKSKSANDSSLRQKMDQLHNYVTLIISDEPVSYSFVDDNDDNLSDSSNNSDNSAILPICRTPSSKSKNRKTQGLTINDISDSSSIVISSQQENISTPINSKTNKISSKSPKKTKSPKNVQSTNNNNNQNYNNIQSTNNHQNTNNINNVQFSNNNNQNINTQSRNNNQNINKKIVQFSTELKSKKILNEQQNKDSNTDNDEYSEEDEYSDNPHKNQKEIFSTSNQFSFQISTPKDSFIPLNNNSDEKSLQLFQKFYSYRNSYFEKIRHEQKPKLFEVYEKQGISKSFPTDLFTDCFGPLLKA